MSKARIFYTVSCNKHGMASESKDVKEVRVSRPSSRHRALNSGCPVCHKEKE